MTRTRRNVILALFAAVLATASLTACSTTAGFGQDMQDAGKGLKNEANKDR